MRLSINYDKWDFLYVMNDGKMKIFGGGGAVPSQTQKETTAKTARNWRRLFILRPAGNENKEVFQ